MSLPSTSRLFTAAFLAALAGTAVAAVFSGRRGIDVFYGNRYFVLTYAHISLVLAVACGFSAAVYLAFPRIFHRRMSEGLGKVHFGLTLVCAASVLAFALSCQIQKASLTVVLTFYLAAMTLAASQILLLINLFRSLGKHLSGAQRA